MILVLNIIVIFSKCLVGTIQTDLLKLSISFQCKNLKTDLKIILINYQNNYIRRSN